MSVIKSIYGKLLDWSGLANIPAALAALARLKGNAGQILSISETDAEGVATAFEAVDKPAGGGNDSGQNPNQSGLSDSAKTLLITILRNGVYSTDQSANITALGEALVSPGGSGGGEDTPDTGVSITQSGGVLTLSGVPAITSITQSGNVLTLA